MMGPTLKTANLTLASPLVFPGIDMSHYLRWLNDPKVTKYSEQRHEKHTRATQYQYMASYTDSPNYMWEIHADCGPIGSITAIRDPYNKTANVGIMIGDVRYWGRGFAVQAYEVVCDFLFANDTRKIEAGTMGANASMIRVLEKAGFEREAIIQDHFLLNGKPQDLHIYGKIREAKIVPFSKASPGTGANGV